MNLYLKCSAWTSSIKGHCEPVKVAESQLPIHTQGIRLCILTRSLGDWQLCTSVFKKKTFVRSVIGEAALCYQSWTRKRYHRLKSTGYHPTRLWLRLMV